MNAFENVDRKGPNQVLASCDFYVSKSYECRGVAQCNPAWKGTVAFCGGAAPWTGHYSGTPEAGTERSTADSVVLLKLFTRLPTCAVILKTTYLII